MGERYGWRPPGYRVQDIPRWDWVRKFEPGHSITAMEIYHGFMRKPFTPMHAFMCVPMPPAPQGPTPDASSRAVAPRCCS